MTARDEAAAAAREHGREVATYEVEGRGLVRNGRKLAPGARIRLAQADADILLRLGRVKRPAAEAAPPGRHKRAGGKVKAVEPGAAH